MLKAFAPVTRRKEIRARCQQISTSIWPTVQSPHSVCIPESHMRTKDSGATQLTLWPSLDKRFRNLKTKRGRVFLFYQPCGNGQAAAFLCSMPKQRMLFLFSSRFNFLENVVLWERKKKLSEFSQMCFKFIYIFLFVAFICWLFLNSSRSKVQLFKHQKHHFSPICPSEASKCVSDIVRLFLEQVFPQKTAFYFKAGANYVDRLHFWWSVVHRRATYFRMSEKHRAEKKREKLSGFSPCESWQERLHSVLSAASAAYNHSQRLFCASGEHRFKGYLSPLRWNPWDSFCEQHKCLNTDRITFFSWEKNRLPTKSQSCVKYFRD